MEVQTDKFSLINGLVLLCVVFACLFLVSPMVVQSRELDRLQMCQNKMRLHCLGVLSKESATMRFPLSMFGKQATVKIDRRQPKAFSAEDGYSWIVALLPYCEQGGLYDKLADASDQFTEPMNSAKLKEDGKYLHAVVLEHLLCPATDESHAKVRGKYPGLDGGQVSNYMSLTAGCVDGSRGTFGDVNPTTPKMLIQPPTSA